MHHKIRAVVRGAIACSAFATWSAYGADADADALALQSEQVEPSPIGTNTKIGIEAAFGTTQRRVSQGQESLRRISADLVYSTRIDNRWRFALSDRVDNLQPHDGAYTVNSLREAYGGWQDDTAAWALEFGRINLRQGPALGFNPTDFFRDSALRVLTTVNPLLVREYRLGSAMLRAQRLWADGSMSFAVSPKLADHGSTAGLSADLGDTNNRGRALLSLNTQWSSRASTQLHVYTEQDGRSQLGASVSALASDTTVLYAEASWGRGSTLLDRTLGNNITTSASRLTAGLTYTTASKLSITGELEYNGFALGPSGWHALAATQPAALGAYLFEADRQQDLASRQALLVYAKQTNAFWRSLDLTAMLRMNVHDHSAMAWVELRQHLRSLDLSVQWVRYRGGPLTEFGLSPLRSTLQVAGIYYF